MKTTKTTKIIITSPKQLTLEAFKGKYMRNLFMYKLLQGSRNFPYLLSIQHCFTEWRGELLQLHRRQWKEESTERAIQQETENSSSQPALDGRHSGVRGAHRGFPLGYDGLRAHSWRRHWWGDRSGLGLQWLGLSTRIPWKDQSPGSFQPCCS